MHFRKERVKLHGRTNFEYRSQDNYKSADLPRIEFLATARNNKFDQLIAKRLTATICNPVEDQNQYYRSTKKQLKQHAQIARPRFAHLEEQERRKPVWVGDSYLIHTTKEDESDDNIQLRRNESQEKKKKKEELIKAKHDQHGTATQETQLIGMEEYAKETLEGKVDIKKVKEIRRAIRRRYANRKNFQKIFTLWDEEGLGKLSVKNVFSMVKKLGLNINLDEARVLVASADEDLSGDLSLDEFMQLIFNDNEALNVDLSKLKPLTGEQQMLLLEGQDEGIDEMLRERIQKQKEHRHFNQLSLILKNKLPNLNQQFQELDPLRQGQVNFEKFHEAITKQQISEKIVNEEVIRGLYDRFKKDEYNIDYRAFLKHLKDFELQSDYTKVEEKKPQKAKPQYTISLNPLDESEKVHVVDCAKANSHQLENLRGRARRMIRVLQRYVPEQKQFEDQVLGKLEGATVEVGDLTKLLSTYITDCGEKVDARDLGALLSMMQYNNKQVPRSKISYYIYEEGDDDFYERCSQQRKGPAPTFNTNGQTGTSMNDQQQTTQPSTFYDSKFGLSSLAQSISPELGAVLAKVESAIFRASSRQYELFQKFDIDKDGYISQTDFKSKLNQMHILNEGEMGLLLTYVDPESKGSVNFQEFYQKLYPGMTLQNGEASVQCSLYPAKERNENLKHKLPTLKRQIETVNFELKAATRFGATPIHKNTFLTIQRPPANSSLYMDEESRFEKNARLKYLHEGQAKEKQIYEKKLERIRQHQHEIHERIEHNYQISVAKEEQKNKTKGLAAWSYEQRAHLQNDWK